MNANELNAIVEFVESEPPRHDDLAGRLRQRFQGHHFTICDEDDICGPEPHIERPSFDVYLVSSAEHCLSLTDQLDLATGVVIAQRDHATPK